MSSFMSKIEEDFMVLHDRLSTPLSITNLYTYIDTSSEMSSLFGDFGSGGSYNDRYDSGDARGTRLDGGADHRSVPDSTGLTGGEKAARTRAERYGDTIHSENIKAHMDKK